MLEKNKKLKILVVCQYYYPEPVRITDICEELVKRGHDVTVLTDVPNYPMGDIYAGYEKKKNREESINGVKIHRVTTIPRKKNALMRFLNYHSFSYFSKREVKKLDNDFDIVLVNQLSPVMMADAAIKYQKKHGKKVIMYCLDLWPESLCAGGIKKNSIIYKIYFSISKRIYEKMDRILVTSKSFVKYLKDNFDIETSKMKYFPQYAESMFDKKVCEKKENDKIDLLFAGNIGKAQSLDTIIEAANALKEKDNLFFHIVGDGQELERLKKKVNNLELKNVAFYGRKPLDEMPSYYSKADAMIVSLCGDSLISSTLPGKVQTYMAAGKPILATANGETKQVIEEAKCGFCSEADSVEKFVGIIRKFIEYKNKKELGENSYNYYKKNFDKNIFIENLITELEKGAIEK